jgi:hypothetical protein
MLEQKEYISIYVTNHTNESIVVYTGLYITIVSVPSMVIQAGNRQAVLVEKGESMSIRGKDTDKDYGSRSFYAETEWDVY